MGSRFARPPGAIIGAMTDRRETAQYGLTVFEMGDDGWSGSTSMLPQPDKSPAARRRYIERQRDGFMHYRAYK